MIRESKSTGSVFCWPAVIALLLPLTTLGQSIYDKPDLRGIENAFVRLAETVRPGVVAIRSHAQVAPGRLVTSQGSGFILDLSGHIVTNHHVVEDGGETFVLLHDGDEYKAEHIASDNRTDLAIIKIDAPNLQPVRLGDLSKVRVGHWTFVVGNPFGMANEDGNVNVAHGIVTALDRTLSGSSFGASGIRNDRFYSNLIQTDAETNPGNSGGPLFNLDGEVIGVIAAIESESGHDEGVSFAIPVDSFTRRVMQTLRRGGDVKHGYLGVRLSGAGPYEIRRRFGSRMRGVLVENVIEDQPASRAGLQPDDLIVSYSGQSIRNRDHLIELVGQTQVGRSVPLEYYRDGRIRSTNVTIGERVAQVVAQSARPETPELTWKGATFVDGRDLVVPAQSSGVFVWKIDTESILYDAGLRPMQEIVRVGHMTVRSLGHFERAVARARRGVSLMLKDGTEIQVPVD
jgi:serine protease Do